MQVFECVITASVSLCVHVSLLATVLQCIPFLSV